MQNPRIVFFGSSSYSVIDAKALFEAFGLTAVVTIPDRIVGRKKILTSSPVKQFAHENNIPILTADKLDPAIIEQIKSLQPDFLVVADYGLLLPETLLTVPTYAPLNVHHSLLPKYRGPSPAPTAILSGEKISGVTIIAMGKELDNGDMLAKEIYTLKANETTQSLLTTLNTLGGKLVVAVIKQYLSGTQKPEKQEETQATFTKHLSKEESFIDLIHPPSKEKLDRMIRAFYPWPNVWTKIKIKNQELRMKFLPEKKIQLEGGKAMTLKEFLNGYPELKQQLQPLFD